ncbi:MAG TPA: hypothetical protein VFG47_21985, partial [Geminicoccaceae bacterium]|nr:hypothetical protein [Geminicoccaceae bacterium]
CGVEGVRVERADELGDALRHAIAVGRPYVLDVHVDANVRPPGVGTWRLPPLPHPEPAFGRPWRPGEAG